MADAPPPPLGGWWNAAYDQLDAFLIEADARLLPPDILAAYADRGARAGWRLIHPFASGPRRLDVLIGDTFPFAAPDLILVDRPSHLTWPHIEADGRLCLFPVSATVDAGRPVKVLCEMLADAEAWLEASKSGANRGDFRAEFLSYWDADAEALKILSLAAPAGPSRMIKAHRGRGSILVAEDASTVRSWRLNASGGEAETADEALEPAALLWLDEPMTPSEFPSSAGEVILQLRAAGLGADVDGLEAKALQRLTVVFGARSEKGAAFCGLTLRRAASAPRARQSLERGFRPGRAPGQIVAARLAGGSRLVRSTVERVDAGWIHGRDGDPDLPRLREARVAVIGSGSLGAPVALALAQAGVGALDLIDPQVLTAANIGRHPLGVDNLGRFKAAALAKQIGEAYPHIREVRAYTCGWEAVASKAPEVLADADLVLSTAADWAAEGSLDLWRRAQPAAPDVLFGWTEPHAVAGHAVACLNGRGCLACGLTAHGEPLLAVSEWPSGRGASFEPACGVSFQPYGPIEAAHVTALVSEAALDVLSGRLQQPIRRTWVARQATLVRAGGVWSAAWQAAEGGETGGRLVERPWSPRPDCVSCGGAA